MSSGEDIDNASAPTGLQNAIIIGAAVSSVTFLLICAAIFYQSRRLARKRMLAQAEREGMSSLVCDVKSLRADVSTQHPSSITRHIQAL